MTPWIAVAGTVLVVLLLLVVSLLRRQLVVVTVAGKSMLPAFQPGDRLLVRRGAAARRLRTGTVAVLREPLTSRRTGTAHGPAGNGLRAVTARPGRKHLVIKRVAALPGDPVPESVQEAAGGLAVVPRGMLVLLADNPAGADSRFWGLVPARYVIGCVVSRLSSR